MDDPLILGLETSGILCSVAWWKNGTILFEYNIEGKNTHSTIIADLVNDSQKALGIDAQEVSIVAVGCGPGSFTGLRIGMAYAKGFCLGRNIPLIPVTNFEILAALAGDKQNPVYTLIEARYDFYYTGVFSGENRELTDKYLADKETLIATIPPEVQIIVHEENQKGAFREALPSERSIQQGDYKSSIICKIGYQAFITHRVPLIDEIEPLYLQAFAGVL